MNLCFFCAHPGLLNFNPEIAKRVVLGSVCEGHLDFKFFYKRDFDTLPVVMTPRMVMTEAEKVARESLGWNN